LPATFGQNLHTPKSIDLISPFDPNQVSGPLSLVPDPGNWVSADQPLSYSIHCENDPNASGKVQHATIVDHLDMAGIDPWTVSLGPIHFGQWTVTPSPNVPPVKGLSEYNTILDLRPAK